jgi:predicted nucleic acid-binding protein
MAISHKLAISLTKKDLLTLARSQKSARANDFTSSSLNSSPNAMAVYKLAATALQHNLSLVTRNERDFAGM